MCAARRPRTCSCGGVVFTPCAACSVVDHSSCFSFGLPCRAAVDIRGGAMRSAARIVVFVAAILPTAFTSVAEQQTAPLLPCAGLADQRLPNTTLTAAEPLTTH